MPSQNKYPVKIRVCEPDITELEVKYVTDAIKNAEISSIASPVHMLENEFAEKFGMRQAIAVNSGGSALFLALKALDIGPGDEVIVPDFTMIATAAAVTHCEATPVFVDASEKSFNIDPEKIEEKITPRTKMIMPVHLYGEPCDMDAIMRIAKKHNLLVVEDAAEAHGAKWKGKLVGTFGKASCFSFYANKIMTTGEGGMILTDDDEYANTLRHIRGYNFDDEKHFWHQTVAWNLRMSALGAALGRAQLARLDELIEKRRKNAAYYMAGLKDVSGIRFFPEPPDTFCVFWMFGILAPRADELMDFLDKHGIETRTFFIPMHVQPVYQSLSQKEGEFRWSTHYGEKGFYLPSASHLTEEQMDVVIAAIKEFY
ncbi:MAG: DegT/DnrJ/EryC1/StrS family aminotransferase [Patescibacteria group bacterium]|nr:DegT/DnrJ/EryC1/StrS family aminotransferase [Patescibacteria group bacterium]